MEVFLSSGLSAARTRLALAIAAAVCVALSLGVTPPSMTSAAPRAPAQKPEAQAPSAQKPDTQAPPTIRVEVDVVNVFATVKDRKGKLINTLDKDDFEVYEDGQRQQIRYFTRESDLPLTLGLLVDTSGSQRALVPAEREAAEVFFRRVLGKKDMAFLISFDTDVDLLQDFTANLQLLSRSLSRLRVNAPGSPTPVARGPFPVTPRGTLLYDAVYLAAEEKLRTEVGRKAIVVITDGEDQGSKMKLGEAVEAAQKGDVIVYGVLFYDPVSYGRAGLGYSGEGALQKIAEETGGRVVQVKRDRNLGAAFEEIAQELRSQYSLGYTPARARSLGGFRRLRIKTVRNNLNVQARSGYYAVANDQ